jgi:hypothetical protein
MCINGIVTTGVREKATNIRTLSRIDADANTDDEKRGLVDQISPCKSRMQKTNNLRHLSRSIHVGRDTGLCADGCAFWDKMWPWKREKKESGIARPTGTWSSFSGVERNERS